MRHAALAMMLAVAAGAGSVVPSRDDERVPVYGPSANRSRTYHPKSALTPDDITAIERAEAKRARRAAKRRKE